MKYLFTLLVLLTLRESAASPAKLKPFSTDYCTNYAEGTSERPNLWKHCCLMHDLYFWAGGGKKDRLNADRELKSCIRDTEETEIAHLVYLAVRAGSYSPFKYPDKKWSNGWINRSEKNPLTRSEIEQIEEELFSSYDGISLLDKNHFINQLYLRLD